MPPLRPALPGGQARAPTLEGKRLPGQLALRVLDLAAPALAGLFAFAPALSDPAVLPFPLAARLARSAAIRSTTLVSSRLGDLGGLMALRLLLDQRLQRFLVAIDELAGVERPLQLIDDLLGDGDHRRVGGLVIDAAEDLVRLWL